MALAKASLPSKYIGFWRPPLHRKRKAIRCPDRRKENLKTYHTPQPRSKRKRLYGAVTLSMMAFLLTCSPSKQAPILAKAFIPTDNCRLSVHRSTKIKGNHKRQLPLISHRIIAPLSAKEDDEQESSGFDFFKRNDQTKEEKGQTKGNDEEDASGFDFFKRKDDSKDEKGKPKRKNEKGQTKGNDEEEASGFDFFKRKDDTKDEKGKAKRKNRNEEENDDDDVMKGIPLVGRFFNTDEEIEEKRRLKKEEKKEKSRLKKEMKQFFATEEAKEAKKNIKREQKEEKVRLKREAKEKKEERKKRKRDRNDKKGNNDQDDNERNGIVGSVKNYFQERQQRKDAENLRFQVLRREEERQKQLEKDAEELRLAVQKREEERKKKLENQPGRKKLKLPSAPIAGSLTGRPSEDIVRQKIQAQKEIDRKRRERMQARADESSVAPVPNKEQSNSKDDNNKEQDKGKSGSKSQRIGNVVSAAQKFVSNVFTDSEEWTVIAPKTRIMPGEIVPVTLQGLNLLLVASKDGSAVHCLANSCPHLGTPLEVGSLDRRPIESGLPNSSSSNNPDIQPVKKETFFQENDIANMLKQDGCEECIVCPLHKTAFALKSGEVRGEWCPYPPVIGKLTGALQPVASLPVFEVRTRGKNIEVRLNTPVKINDDSPEDKKK